MTNRRSRPGGSRVPAAALLAAAVLSPSAVGAQTESLVRGRVLDAESGEPLPAANVRILDTGRGTMANAEGEYLIRVPRGRHALVFSYIGFESDTLTTRFTSDRRYDARLRRALIPQVPLIVSGDDPARAIIRRAVDAKKEQLKGLESYRFDAYTRRVIAREDSVAGVLESYTVGWWKQGQPVKEQLVQERMTENLPEVEGLQGVLAVQDFSADDIELGGNRYIGPLHPDTFRWYDFTLDQTLLLEGAPVYVIGLHPRSRMVPLLDGEVHIADGSWALVGVDLEPAEPILIPFVKDLRIRWRQRFRQQEGGWWLPSDVRTEGGIEVAVGPITIPRIGFDQTSIIYDYDVNAAVPDSILEREARLAALPEAAAIDSSFWREREVLPLTREEQRAYVRLDSTQTLEEQFAPRGFGMEISEESMSLGASAGVGGAVGTLLGMLDVGCDRVDGNWLGVRAEIDSAVGGIDLRLRVRHAFSADRWMGRAELVFPRSRDREGRLFRLLPVRGITSQLRLAWFDETRPAPNARFYPEGLNSLGVLISKHDAFDYFGAEGWRVTADVRIPGWFRGDLYFGQEDHTLRRVVTGYSLIDRSSPFRPNPAATEGRYTRSGITLDLGQPESVAGVMTGNGVRLRMEGIGPDFQHEGWGVLEGVLSLRVDTWTGRFLFSPYLTVRAAGGWAAEDLPAQFWMGPEAALGIYGPLGSLRAAGLRELVGPRYWSVSAEHNFRHFPFLYLGLRPLAERGLEVLLHGSAARAWNGGAWQPVRTPYCEAGIGIGRIWDILRLDLTRRLNGEQAWRLTLALTTFL
ncbi:MAG: DUF5686 family protein [bacterium]